MKTSKFTDEQLAMPCARRKPAPGRGDRPQAGRQRAEFLSLANARRPERAPGVAPAPGGEWQVERVGGGPELGQDDSPRGARKTGKARGPPRARALGAGGVPGVRPPGLPRRGGRAIHGPLPEPPALAARLRELATVRTEFTSRMLNPWAYWQHVALEFSRPGKPVDNTFIESFNGTLRRECFSLHWSLNLAELQQTLNAWRED